MYVKILLILIAASVGVFSTDPDPPPNFSGKDVTRSLFADKIDEEFFPAAFGDFNADKHTDIFTISKNRSTIAVYIAREEEPMFIKKTACDIVVPHGHSNLGVEIRGVSVGDFNGDGMLDVLVTFKQPGTHGYIEIQIFAGNGDEMDCFHPLKPGIEMRQEPLILDVDGDMIMDLVGEEVIYPSRGQQHHSEPDTSTASLIASNFTFQKTVWKFFPSKTIEYESYPIKIKDGISPQRWKELEEEDLYDQEKVEIIKPSSNAIVDIDGDSVPELLIVTELANPHGKKFPTNHPLFFFEAYRINGETSEKKWELELFDVVPLLNHPKDDVIQLVGQPMFIDLNQDGNILHVLPFCTDKYCKTPGFKAISWGSRNVTQLDVSFQDESGTQWTFLKISENATDTNWFDLYFKTGLVYRVGDYNMDGYPDLMGVLMTEKGGALVKQYRAVIFENVPCISPNPTKPCPFPRTFRIDFKSLSAYENVTMATFFDIYDDGLIDVLLVRRTNSETQKDKDKYSCSGILSNPDYDANYLKVVVTSGRACQKCKLDGIPYGNVIPGPIIKYNATTQEGEEKFAVAAQMYRSSHLPLDLPYTIFGIGHSPNFIDVLEVHWSPSRAKKSSNKWTQLIPNSQIIVIPPAPPSVSGWRGKIFLPSTKAPFHTFMVLLGFCGIIAIIALILQYKERREDRKERLLETHRFHMM